MNFSVSHNGQQEGDVFVSSAKGTLSLSWYYTGEGLTVSFYNIEQWTSFCAKQNAAWALDLRENVKFAIKSHKDFKFRHFEDRGRYLLFHG